MTGDNWDDYENSHNLAAPDYADDGFHTLDSVRYVWADAPWQDTILSDLLEAAKDQVLAYALAEDVQDDVPVPARLRMAQFEQARDHWNSARVNPTNGDLGDGTFQLSTFPMTWHVQQMIRPKSAVPVLA